MSTCLERKPVATSEFGAYLRDRKVCVPCLRWGRRIRSFEEAWYQCPNPDWVLSFIGDAGYDDVSRLRLWACWCVRQVWTHVTDARSRGAVESAEAFVRGSISQEQLQEAWGVATSLAQGAWRSAAAAWGARAAADAAGPTPCAAGLAAAEAAMWAGGADAWETSRKAQAEQLRVVVGEDGSASVFAYFKNRYGVAAYSMSAGHAGD